MSNDLMHVKAALETRLKAMTALLPTEWENTKFVPPINGAAYQSVFMIPFEPANPCFGGIPGREVHREEGIFQIILRYPIGGGAGSPTAKAEAIRDWFPRGASYTFGGTTVVIQRTPKIGPAKTDADRYLLPVSIRYFANVIP